MNKSYSTKYLDFIGVLFIIVSIILYMNAQYLEFIDRYLMLTVGIVLLIISVVFRVINLWENRIATKTPNTFSYKKSFFGVDTILIFCLNIFLVISEIDLFFKLACLGFTFIVLIEPIAKQFTVHYYIQLAPNKIIVSEKSTTEIDLENIKEVNISSDNRKIELILFHSKRKVLFFLNRIATSNRENFLIAFKDLLEQNTININEMEQTTKRTERAIG